MTSVIRQSAIAPYSKDSVFVQSTFPMLPILLNQSLWWTFQPSLHLRLNQKLPCAPGRPISETEKALFLNNILKFSTMRQSDVLYSSYVANCVLNAFSSYVAIMLNILTIHAMRKTSSLPKTLKTLLLSLAVSDLGVGLVVQPFYIILLVKRLQQNNEGINTLQIAFLIVMNLFSCASFFGVLLISVDRFLAIHLHLRYQQLVTHKRVVTAVISTWAFSAFFSSVKLWIPTNVTQPSTIAVAIFFGLFFVSTTMIYYNIYLTVQRHRKLILMQQVARNSEDMTAANDANIKKTAVGAFYVYLVFVLCYLPGYLMMISRTIVSETNIAMESFDPYSWTLVFINSSLNPVIYCLKMRHIRHAITDTLRNVSFQNTRNKKHLR